MELNRQVECLSLASQSVRFSSWSVRFVLGLSRGMPRLRPAALEACHAAMSDGLG
jgi:hypothetical protein